MDRIEYIRTKEKEYHDYCYNNHELFAEGTWLDKPVKPVMDELHKFNNRNKLNILDLGCGVGRNSIPMAKTLRHREGKVVCVDILDSAINKLNEYCKKYDLLQYIDVVKSDIEIYEIKENNFDYIVAVSSLEHLSSKEMLFNKLNEMALGTKSGGSNCIVINTNISEVDITSNTLLDPMWEINLSSNEMLDLLKAAYENWHIETQDVLHGDFPIVRDNRPVSLKTDCLNFVARKP